MKSDLRILVVDDEPVQRESLAVWLREDGYAVDEAPSGEQAVEMAGKTDYALLFVDLKMAPGIDGIETMAEVRKVRPDAAIVIITAYATIDTAVAAIRQGAAEYVVKPCDPKEISRMVERILRLRDLQRENVLLRKRLLGQYTFHDITSKNSTMFEICELIKNVASLKTTVLIQGESGTGKELVARAIHACSDRADKPFVAVPCTALAETLLETELFGHERGAFTGAVGQRKGKFEQADGGTILLDEIGDISPKLQVELLRVLQERAFCRVGGSSEVRVDVRVIAASNVNLQEAVKAGRFRDDLFYRLNVITIHVPPLRERMEDVPLLAREFLEQVRAETGRDVAELSDGAMRLLMSYEWPGNVRELENAVERAVVVARGRTLEEHDFAWLQRRADEHASWSPPPNLTLREIEQRAIESTLQRTMGNIKAAAEALGIDRSTLYDKIKRGNLSRPAEV